jgi:hypothetical protein
VEGITEAVVVEEMTEGILRSGIKLLLRSN